MANFLQRKLARESVEGTGTVVPDGLELPAESVEGILAELAQDEKEINQNDSEHDVLTEDANETDAQLDAVDEADAASQGTGEEGDDGEAPMEAEEDMPDEAADALDVAQESIRKRWGFDHRVSVAQEAYGSRKRRQVARESLWDDIKAFFRRIWEWLKEQGRKVKDRWLKFSNQGKSIQARSKKFDAAIRKLGKQKKDTVSGSFIKQLSVAGKFVGNDVSALNAQLTATGKLADLQKSALDTGADIADAAAKEDTAAIGSQYGEFVRGNASTRDEECLGSNKLHYEVEGTGADTELTVTYIPSESEVEGDVKTPTPAQLSSLNSFYNKLGIEVEKRVKAYHSINQARDKYESAVEKLLKKIDGVKIDENAKMVQATRLSRKMISSMNSVVSNTERALTSIVTNLVSGTNGYIAAGIAAHEKA
ncbi:internal head protein [Erwinia phage vB_EamM_ChrisDB]|uniref:internal head protein n=1 Tax=Erwinia phage vB_EamM_ChrisDB TaxID=1883371 RepID=UPI00081C7C39|nr:internal head protein [Erwinia phage vB_EamM_ChrisDB]ANZ48632.1 hypothetical protein CHRISDB_70 [Erwinia phage vB_EamM_ChrisDB]